MSAKIKAVFIRLTPLEADQLHSVVNAANRDGDHEDWIRSAGATPGEIRALRSVMRKTAEAAQQAQTRKP